MLGGSDGALRLTVTGAAAHEEAMKYSLALGQAARLALRSASRLAEVVWWEASGYLIVVYRVNLIVFLLSTLLAEVLAFRLPYRVLTLRLF